MAGDIKNNDKVVSIFEAIKKQTQGKDKDNISEQPESSLEEIIKKNKEKEEKLKKERLKINRLVLKSYRLKF